MTISYTRDIPDGPHNPSVDQPPMKLNTNAIDDILAVNHFNFNVANGCKHKFVEMRDSVTIPAGLTTGEGTIYARTSVVNPGLNLFYTNSNSGNEYRLTTVNDANYATFSGNTNYAGPPVTPVPTLTGGWTFLPGGLYLQYGIATSANLATNFQVNFPVAFVSFVASITITPLRPNTNDKGAAIFDGAGGVTLTGFQLQISSADRPSSMYWMAIGK